MELKDIWLWLAYFTKGRNDIIKSLLETYKSIEEIYRSDEKKLREQGKLTEEETEQFIKLREEFDAKSEWEKLHDRGIKFVALCDSEYPDKLRKYQERPFFLFYKGNLPKDYIPSVAMVGARACSNYGRTMAKNIGKELSANGVQIISGMARGIDTYSQLGAVSGGTPTFAVLGCGVDICYPTENIELYQDILENGGGIISEYIPEDAPLAWHFPQRNRIISGLADKIAIIEAKEKSGSLITVEWALEQGKDIFAVPGRVNDVMSAGCNRLLKAGAGVLTEASDILSDLNYNMDSIIKITSLNEKNLEKDLLLVYSELGLHPKSVQHIIEETRLEYGVIMEILLKLQLMGLVEETCKNYYARADAT